MSSLAFEFGFKDLIDILLVAVILYETYRLLRKSGVANLFWGVLAFIVVWFLVSFVFQLELTSALFDRVISVGAIALIVIFQEEIRMFFNRLGGRFSSWKIFRNKKGEDAQSNQQMSEVIRACRHLSSTKTGALIVISKDSHLKEIIDTGERLDAAISARLIENIFFKNTPLHDGAMILEKGKIVAAACILPVSKMLEDAMKNCGIENNNWQRIHNVVDDFFYQPIAPVTITPKGNKFRFVHVSCFDEKAKNIQGMLRAVRMVAKHRQDFELICVGTGIDYTKDVAYAQTLDFPEKLLTFTGEQTPYEVAQWMQQSDCFLFFSRYENAPVVISECLAIGLPIISSNAGGIPEMIDHECGILVPSEDEAALANAILEMIDNQWGYTTETIQKRGTKYTYQNIGKHLSDLYQRVVISAN